MPDLGHLEAAVYTSLPLSFEMHTFVNASLLHLLPAIDRPLPNSLTRVPMSTKSYSMTEAYEERLVVVSEIEIALQVFKF